MKRVEQTMRDGVSHGGRYELEGDGLRGDSDLFAWWDDEHKRMVRAMTIDNRDEVQAQGNDAAYLRASKKIEQLQADLDAHGVKLEKVRSDLDACAARVTVLEQQVAEVTAKP